MKTLALLCVGALALAAQTSPTLSLANASATSVAAGSAVSFDVVLSGGAGLNMAAAQWKYSGAIVPTTAIGIAGTAAAKTIATGGTSAILYGQNQTFLSDGAIARATFTVPASATVRSTLSFGLASALGADINSVTGSAGVAIGVPLAGIAITVAPPLSPCDLNQDSKTDSSDVLLLLSELIKILSEPSATLATKYDLNGDGELNVVDLQREIHAANTGICKVGP